jgi:hypothetical protein
MNALDIQERQRLELKLNLEDDTIGISGEEGR